jgi:omega-6 fatty acid desaturase (delta-12 desaturase)
LIAVLRATENLQLESKLRAREARLGGREARRTLGRAFAQHSRPGHVVVPYLGLSVAMYFSLRVSYFLTLAIGVFAAGFLLRTYIMFHDCSHGSFLPSRRGNRWLGMVLGVVVLTPFLQWRHNHAIHHATAGDLDRRGGGDVPTLTVEEYYSRDWRGRLGYRLFRNPLVMFGLVRCSRW